MKIIREHINEKFEQNSDPIHDLGIGERAVWDSLKNGDILRIKNNINPSHPKDVYIVIYDIIKINKDLIDFRYYQYNSKNELLANLNKNKKNKPAASWSMRFDFFKHNFELIHPDTLNEKFEEDTDPIHDLGIGKNTLKFRDYIDPDISKHDYQKLLLKKYFKEFKDTVESLIKGMYVTGRMWEVGGGRWQPNNFTIKVVKILSPGTIFKDPKKFGMLYFNVLASNGKKYCLYLINEYKISGYKPRKLYEKFKQQSDTIKDLGIGLYAIEMNTNIDIKEKNGKWSINNHEKWFLKELKKRNITYKIVKANDGNWPLIKYIGTKNALISMLFNMWTIDDSEFDSYVEQFKEINEEFKENTDPIADMNIGMMKVIKDYVKNQYETTDVEHWSNSQLFRSCISRNKINFVDYFLDKGLVDIHEDEEAALRIAVYNERYKMAMHLINRNANLKDAINFSIQHNEKDTIFNFQRLKSLMKNKQKIDEKFKEESDPIEDLGIGLLHHISNGLKKLKLSFGVEFISLEKYFSDAWVLEVRYNNPHNKKGIIDKIKECLGEELFRNIGTQLYGNYGKVIGIAVIKKEYMQAFNKVLDDVGNIKDF